MSKKSKIKSKLKLKSDMEKDFFDTICAISEFKKDTVREVLRAVLLTIVANIYAQNSKTVKVNIPYICDLDISYADVIRKDEETGKSWREVKVDLNANPANALYKEIEFIHEGEDPPSLLYLEAKLKRRIEDILDLPLEDEEE